MGISYYNYLAEDYNLKRQKPWKALQDFFHRIENTNLKTCDLCLDIGCGNGRNFPLLSSVSSKIVGIDNSIELLKLAKKNMVLQMKDYDKANLSIQLILCSINSIPVRPEAVDGGSLIAVIHHIKGRNNRKAIMRQIYQAIKDNGWIIVSVWRKYQKKYRAYFLKDLIRRLFLPNYIKAQSKLGLEEFGDKQVPWTLSKENKTYLRFYHFFSLREARNLMKKFQTVKMIKLGGPGKKDNYFFLAKKAA